jgi:hypothetical protein
MARLFCGEKTPSGEVGRELSPLSDEWLNNFNQVLVPVAEDDSREGAMASTEGYRLLFRQGDRMLATCVRREVASSQALQARFRSTTLDSIQNLDYQDPKAASGESGMCNLQKQMTPLFRETEGEARENSSVHREGRERQQYLTVAEVHPQRAGGKGQRNKE